MGADVRLTEGLLDLAGVLHPAAAARLLPHKVSPLCQLSWLSARCQVKETKQYNPDVKH